MKNKHKLCCIQPTTNGRGQQMEIFPCISLSLSYPFDRRQCDPWDCTGSWLGPSVLLYTEGRNGQSSLVPTNIIWPFLSTSLIQIIQCCEIKAAEN